MAARRNQPGARALPGASAYAYGVLRSDVPVEPSTPGVFEAPIHAIERDGLAVVVSSVDGPVPARRQDLLAHFAVLESLVLRGTVLPLRFGTVFDSEDEAVLELLVRRRAVLEALLEELDGLVEVAVRATYDQAAVMREIVEHRRDIRRLSDRTKRLPEDATYFDRIRLGELVAEALELYRQRDGEAIHDALRPLAREFADRGLSSERLAFSGSFLVERVEVGGFREAVERLERDSGGRMSFRVTAPLPPYSFTSLDDQPVPAGGS